MLASHVLEDIWQVKDCLLRLLPQSHSALKKFRLAFGETIFLFDKNDQAQIKEFLEKKWDQALRRNPGEIYRRCWRYKISLLLFLRHCLSVGELFLVPLICQIRNCSQLQHGIKLKIC